MTRALILAVALAACAAPKATESLSDTIRAYNDSIRWERYEVAAVHLPAKERSERLDEWDERAHDLKITDYDIVKVDQKGPREARVTIKLSWYLESEGKLHETHTQQVWERHDRDWIMVDESRLRGVEMPGLTESATTSRPATDHRLPATASDQSSDSEKPVAGSR